MKRRVGVLGGTFDPPHLAHLVLAEAARRDLDLDEVWFIPAGRPPHKLDRRLSPARVRLALLRLAVRGIAGFRVLPLELTRRGPSYTVDTLEALHRRRPVLDLWLLVGSDTLGDLDTWRRPERVVELASLAVLRRPGHPARRPSRVARGRFHVVDAPRLEISSSELRERVARGASIRFLVPEAVEHAVHRRGLYGARRGRR